MKLTEMIFALTLSVGLLGCNSRSDRATISADELLIAQGGYVFTVLTPEQVDPLAFYGLALKYPDGSISPFSSSNNLKPNQELKIIVFEPRDGTIRYTILGDGLMQRGESQNFPDFDLKSTIQKTTMIKADQPLIRFCKGNSISVPPSNLKQGEFDLVLHIQKSKSEKAGSSNGG